MTPLEREIRAVVGSEGPISVARYMALCLGHPVHGYYTTRDPFGAAGDFVTAPEISQMFGELIGVWAAAVHESMGAPDPVRLVELGPGRGTLMADALRAASVRPRFRAAIEVHLVETSPVLRERQRSTLAASGAPVSWHGGVEELPDGPSIVLANEFFDALPVRQFVAVGGQWRERMVGLDQGRLAFGLGAAAEAGLPLARGAPEGTIAEFSPEAIRLAAALGARSARNGGAALIIDYGYDGFATGDSLQAVRHHRFVDPLDAPGTADLTAHVSFRALTRAARSVGATAYGPVPQADFLERLGLRTRAARLAAQARADAGGAIADATDRLTDRTPTGMGTLVKALAFAHPGLPPPPAFTG